MMVCVAIDEMSLEIRDGRAVVLLEEVSQAGKTELGGTIGAPEIPSPLTKLVRTHVE